MKKEIVAASDAESTVYGVSVLSQIAVIAALTDGVSGWPNLFGTCKRSAHTSSIGWQSGPA